MLCFGNPQTRKAGRIAMTAMVTIQLRRSLLLVVARSILCRNRRRGERAGSGRSHGAAAQHRSGLRQRVGRPPAGGPTRLARSASGWSAVNVRW